MSGFSEPKTFKEGFLFGVQMWKDLFGMNMGDLGVYVAMLGPCLLFIASLAFFGASL